MAVITFFKISSKNNKKSKLSKMKVGMHLTEADPGKS